MVASLGDRFDFRIITRDRDHTQSEPYAEVEQGAWTTVGKASVLYASGRQLRLRSLSRAVRDAEPDLVFANSLFSIITLRYLLLRWSRRVDRVPLLVTPRGELGGGALSIKSAQKHLYLVGGRALKLFNGVRWQASSPAEADAISARLPQAEPLVASNIPFPPIADSLEHPDKVAGSVVFVFVARISRMKNLPFLLEILSELHGDIRLEVYGTKEEGEWQTVESMIGSVPENIKVSFHGAVAPEEVDIALARGHFFILPTLGENVGHSIYEALRVGRPVVISDRTPWSDVHDTGAGWVLPLERRRDWVGALQECVDIDAAAYLPRVTAAHSYAVQWFERANPGERQAQVFDEIFAGSRPPAE
jgi:glycosyltransferase involved in cell wall biosynthesis